MTLRRNTRHPLREPIRLDPRQNISAMSSSLALHLPWWRSSTAGYVASPILVALMTIARLFVTEPLFIWAPFCLIVVVAGFFWGIGPALITMLLAILAISYVVIPQYDLLTLDIWNDITLFAPFILVQSVIALLAARHAVQYRKLLVAKQELQASAYDLAVMNRQLERAHRLQQEFFTRAAHELRTPLTTILGEAQLALRRLRKARQPSTDMVRWQTHFEKIEERARILHRLVEDMIELYHARSEEPQVHQSLCDVGKLCHEVIEDQQALSGRQIALELPNDPLILRVDIDCLRLVITNITDNAIAYSPADTTIQVTLQSAPDAALLSVHNEDAELSQEQQEQVFEPFYRTPSAQAANQEGWGLGLTVSKACVERQGGRIWIESAEGKGVTVWVTIPFGEG